MALSVQRWEKPGEPAQKVLLEKELKAQGYRTEFWVDKPGVSYLNRKHDADSIIWVLRGEAKLTIGAELETLRDGDRTLLSAGTSYSFETLGGKSLLWLFGLKKKKS